MFVILKLDERLSEYTQWCPTQNYEGLAYWCPIHLITKYKLKKEAETVVDVSKVKWPRIQFKVVTDKEWEEMIRDDIPLKDKKGKQTTLSSSSSPSRVDSAGLSWDDDPPTKKKETEELDWPDDNNEEVPF